MRPTTLHIPLPCNETLERAQQGGSALYCATCQKHVHDLSDASDAEIVAFFEGQKSPVCARLRKSQIDRRLVAASTKKPPALHDIDLVMQAPRDIILPEMDGDVEFFKGRVLSAADKKPIEHAYIELLKSDFYTTSDEQGDFILPIPVQLRSHFRISIFRAGYEEKRVTMKNYTFDRPKTFRLKDADYCLAGDVLYRSTD